MDFHLERAKIVAGLPPLKRRRRGTGAVSLSPDTQLLAMSSFAKIQAAVPAVSADLSVNVKEAYDQGTEDSCVAFSIAGMQSIFEQILNNQWLTFDAEELYKDNGGTGGNGISVKAALSWDQTTGLKDLANGQRYKIQNSAFADPMTAEGIDAIKSAITASCPCVLALLLPSDFDDQFGKSGDCNGTVTSDYHQICVIGYDADRFTFLNSWGNLWGKKGMGTIAWNFLQLPEQTGSVYAYTTTDTGQPGAKPFLLKAWTDLSR